MSHNIDIVVPQPFVMDLVIRSRKVYLDIVRGSVDPGAVRSVTGTANRILVNNTNPRQPVVNIDPAYDQAIDDALDALALLLLDSLAFKAPLASPVFTGTPTAPTAVAGTNTTQIATCAFVLANAPTVSRPAGEILFGTGASYSSNAGFTYSNSTGVFTVGTGTAPSVPLLSNVTASVNGPVGLSIRNANGGAAANSALVLETNHIFYIKNFVNGFAGNFAGSSIPKSQVVQFSTSNDNNTLPLVFSGTPIYHIIGTTATNYGTRLDANGFRIGQLSTLHTANTTGVIFDAGNLTWNGSTLNVTTAFGNYGITYQRTGGSLWRINVDGSDFYRLDRSGGGEFFFKTSSAAETMLGIGVSPAAGIDIRASTALSASLRIRSGIAPTSPNDGDVWFDGANLKMRIAGVTKTFTIV